MPQFLKPYFWDIDFTKIDPKNNKEFIVTRLLEKGRVECLSWLLQTYTKNEIRDIIKLDFNLNSETKNLALQLVN